MQGRQRSSPWPTVWTTRAGSSSHAPSAASRRPTSIAEAGDTLTSSSAISRRRPLFRCSGR
eukprot:1017009-Lingulodinium_polyedra.AAC.1